LLQIKADEVRSEIVEDRQPRPFLHLSQPHMLPKRPNIICDRDHTRLKKQIICPKLQQHAFLALFPQIFNFEFATSAGEQLGLVCDRHHISSATNILGLAFRNAALIISDEDGS
jgi:hypothetical protein